MPFFIGMITIEILTSKNINEFDKYLETITPRFFAFEFFFNTLDIIVEPNEKTAGYLLDAFIAEIIHNDAESRNDFTKKHNEFRGQVTSMLQKVEDEIEEDDIPWLDDIVEALYNNAHNNGLILVDFFESVLFEVVLTYLKIHGYNIPEQIDNAFQLVQFHDLALLEMDSRTHDYFEILSNMVTNYSTGKDQKTDGNAIQILKGLLLLFASTSIEKKSYIKIEKNITRFPDKKVGRNDNCPCGSGKKYKNCCMKPR